jgi:very-short-patch-repair endonuclease
MNVHASQFFVGSTSGLTRSQLRAGVAARAWVSTGAGIYRHGGWPATPLDRALGVAVATDGVVSGALTALLEGYDAGGAPIVDVTVDRTASTEIRGLRHRLLAPERIVEVAGFRCTDGLQTLVDLAHRLDDDHWEQALEWVARRDLTVVAGLRSELPHLGRQRIRGTRRIRRVLFQRPEGAPATESLLETLMVQIARLVPDLHPPQRQVDVFDRWGDFVARVDLAWPELGIFIELDGQHHEDQPVYDASRETAVVAATGWLCGRFTWDECTTRRMHTARRLDGIVRQARQRPLRSAS